MKKYLWLLFGSFLVAFGLYFFLLSNDIAAGGLSGLALVLSEAFPFLNLGLVNLGLNILVLISGVVFISFDFAKKSLLSSLSLSFFIIVFERLMPGVRLGDDLIISIIFGSIIVSLGLAVVFHNGASSGGTDLIGAILNRKFSVPLHLCLFLADFVVVALSAKLYGLNTALYATFAIMIQSIGLDYFIQGFGRKVAIVAISDKYEEINDILMKKYERGVTLLKAEGGYSGDDKKVVMTVTSFRQFPLIKDDILSLDDRAFIFTYSISEVLGEGFTLEEL